jgi:hypothetical protein
VRTIFGKQPSAQLAQTLQNFGFMIATFCFSPPRFIDFWEFLHGFQRLSRRRGRVSKKLSLLPCSFHKNITQA